MELKRYGVLSLVAVLAFALGAYAAKQKASTVISATELKWQPLNPNNPNGPQIAVVWGDLKKGPVGFIAKFPAGHKSRAHWHTADYGAVLIKGTWIHSDQGGPEGKPLEPGSYWFQPGKAPHVDECQGPGECLGYADFRGPFDSHLVDETASNPPVAK